MTIRTALEHIPIDLGIKYLKKYYGLLDQSHPENGTQYHGSYFESLDSDITEKHSNRITGSDLYALSTLQIEVPRAAGIGILDEQRSQITALLEQIPVAKLEDLSATEFNEHLSRESPAQHLWNILCRHNPGDKKWGVGPTTASKIMARKRPDLIPIQDSVVDSVIGRQRGEDPWKLWWDALTPDNYLLDFADALRHAAKEQDKNFPELSTLRILDVVLWMFGQDQNASTK